MKTIQNGQFKLLCYFKNEEKRCFYSLPAYDKKKIGEKKLIELAEKIVSNKNSKLGEPKCIILIDNTTNAELQRWQNGDVIYS